MRLNVVLVSSFFVLISGPSLSEPRIVTETNTFSANYSTPVNGFGASEFSIPGFDNGRFILRDATVSITYNQFFQGPYRNFSQQPFGVTFGAVQGTQSLVVEGFSSPSSTSMRNVFSPIDCVDTGGSDRCFRFSINAAFEFGDATLTQSQTGNFSESIGGSASLQSSLAYVPFTPSSFDGLFSGSITGAVQYTYDATTAREYALEAYNRALNDPLVRDGNEADFIRSFYREAILLRESEAPFTNVNLNIRDVEYFGRGFSGGQLLRNPDQIGDEPIGGSDTFNDIANVLVPISAPIYEQIKEIFGSQAVIEEGTSPASEPGGSGIAIEGWQRAITGEGLLEAIGSSFPSGNAPVPTPEIQPLSVLPNALAPRKGGRFEKVIAAETISPFFLDQRISQVDVFFGEDIVGKEIIDISLHEKDYSFVSGYGGFFESIFLSSSELSNFEIIFGSHSISLESNQKYLFSDLIPGKRISNFGLDFYFSNLIGDSSLSLLFNSTNNMNLVASVAFDGDKEVTPTPIPIPGTLAFMFLGLFGLLILRRCQSKSVFEDKKVLQLN
ncbi:MAG: hypothetical protein AAGE61_00780 [Pseudomonadota bacterium]